MDRFRWGQWNAVCDRCGFEFKSPQLAKEWTGLRVCRGPGTNNCFEHRHPQDFVRGRADRQAPPWVRPEPPAIQVPTYEWNDTLKQWVSGSADFWILTTGFWNDGGEWVDAQTWADNPTGDV